MPDRQTSVGRELRKRGRARIKLTETAYEFTWGDAIYTFPNPKSGQSVYQPTVSDYATNPGVLPPLIFLNEHLRTEARRDFPAMFEPILEAETARQIVVAEKDLRAVLADHPETIAETLSYGDAFLDGYLAGHVGGIDGYGEWRKANFNAPLMDNGARYNHVPEGGEARPFTFYDLERSQSELRRNLTWFHDRELRNIDLVSDAYQQLKAHGLSLQNLEAVISKGSGQFARITFSDGNNMLKLYIERQGEAEFRFNYVVQGSFTNEIEAKRAADVLDRKGYYVKTWATEKMKNISAWNKGIEQDLRISIAKAYTALRILSAG